MSDTDHPELVEFEGETLGDTLTNLLTEVKRLRERLRDATDLLYDCEYYICPTCNQWADRNYDCENCKEADE